MITLFGISNKRRPASAFVSIDNHSIVPTPIESPTVLTRIDKDTMQTRTVQKVQKNTFNKVKVQRFLKRFN